MCGVCSWDKKTRRLYAAAMVFLFGGMALALFDRAQWSMQHRALYDGLRGLLLGLTIGFLMCVARRKRRSCSTSGTS